MLVKLWKKFQKYKKKLACAGFVLCAAFAYGLLLESIPDTMYVEQGKTPAYAFDVPVTEHALDSAQAFADGRQTPDGVHRTRAKSYRVQCRLFGVLPIKQIQVQEVKRQSLLPGGMNIGIYVKHDAVMIIGTGEVEAKSGGRQEPAKNIVRSGDYLLAIDGEHIDGKKQLMKKIAASDGENMTLLLLRDGKKLEVSMRPVLSKEGVYQLGIWVRDDIAGVGTLTYVTKGLSYGALGHGINDADTGSLIPLQNGAVYRTTIVGIRKGEKGQPGEMSGMINYSAKYRLGSVDENTQVGIYGRLDAVPKELCEVTSVPVAFKEEIQKGSAQILSSVEGTRRAYDIEIEQTDYHSEGNNKGIRFRVTDRQLLADTGGIVQGMSGSPILQNGKIIGAVTHVFVADSTQGYGVFIENMLAHSNS